MQAGGPSATRAVIENGLGANGGQHPRYVAIVSDGSARWALARGLAVSAGHDAAADAVIARIADAVDLGIEELTLYAFSTENWARPAEEVAAVLSMLARRIAADTPKLHEQGVRVRFIGRRDRAGDELTCAMHASEALTAANDGLGVYVAFDYGGRDEILGAADRYRGGGEAEFARLMHCAEMHDPDLVIRTSGEKRLSNFLLWQVAYSELVFRDELWPDFTRVALEECLAEYTRRRRRFGGREAVAAAARGGFLAGPQA
ncbi:MAG TPA: polyprenyl diphosphate synthase [Solirubrobacteraceae bacterium]|jgi:undecaprenyl diphosphate synthase|nr:polyprenyl diphosphate synthase [Solirubrobacteraceae bacterium]